MSGLSTSPDQVVSRVAAELGDDTLASVYARARTLKEQIEAEPEWREDNLEADLRTTQWILDKVRGDRVYAQHLYAALCNNIWQRLDTWCLLSNKTWDCSWRHAGGIVADMRGSGTYTDWYCSGRNGFNPIWSPDESDWANMTEEDIAAKQYREACVSEQVVTEEIAADLKRLGWQLSAKQHEPD